MERMMGMMRKMQAVSIFSINTGFLTIILSCKYLFEFELALISLIHLKASSFCLASSSSSSLMRALGFLAGNELLIAWYFLSTDQPESPEAEDQRDSASPAPTSPNSRDSSPDRLSRPPSQPSSTSQTSSRPGSQPASSPDSRSNTSANSMKKKSKTSKPAHLRRNIRY